MKQLQNNFTTPEQSKRLLELGLSADSADGVYQLKQVGINFIMSKTPDIIPPTIRLSWGGNTRIPCWSVGRLIEIWQLCIGSDYIIYNDDNLTETLIDNIAGAIENNYMNFSKLEE